MSSDVSTPSATDRVASPPAWLAPLLGVQSLAEGDAFDVGGQSFAVRGGIPRSQRLVSDAQAQTREAFGYKWSRRDTFESEASRAHLRGWLVERYGEVASAPWLFEQSPHPLFIDAGCGAGRPALELLGPVLSSLRYLGVDIADAVDVARLRFAERGLPGGFLQADIADLPLPAGSVDMIFSEGALHHTNSTEQTLRSLARVLAPGGRFLFYVYRRKGPVREFTDDHIRAQMRQMSPQQAWSALEPLTRLGIELGRLDAEVDIPEPIGLLDIPAGRTTVQRLFYWHVAKAFYRPDFSFDEMNHVNFDWYAPASAHRQTPEDVRRWCAEADMVIEREVVEDAGITVIARKA